MKFKVLQTFEGSLGDGPRTLDKGFEFEDEPVGEVRYWLDMGWIIPVKEKREKAVVKAPEKRTRRKTTKK